jgi:DNA-directed RNA polymerase subunit E'/Rpb7
MTRLLPAVADAGRLRTELRFVRPEDRDDAVQEAWLAHLQGRVLRARGAILTVKTAEDTPRKTHIAQGDGE